MADNYIERQFEQYQAKKAAWQKPLKHTSKKTNSKRVFITGGANGIGKAIVKAKMNCNSGKAVQRIGATRTQTSFSSRPLPFP